MRGIHGEKLVAAKESSKLPSRDRARLDEAINVYDRWVKSLEKAAAETIDEYIALMVNLLNVYKHYIDIELIFDSKDDFLYRQKGQLKIDNSIMEEFLPYLVRKCVAMEFGECSL